MDEMKNPNMDNKAFDDLQAFMFSSDQDVDTMPLDEVSAELTRLSIDPTTLVARVQQLIPIENAHEHISHPLSTDNTTFDDLQAFMFSSDQDVDTMPLDEVSAELTRLSIDPTTLVARVQQLVPIENTHEHVSPAHTRLLRWKSWGRPGEQIFCYGKHRLASLRAWTQTMFSNRPRRSLAILAVSLFSIVFFSELSEIALYVFSPPQVRKLYSERHQLQAMLGLQDQSGLLSPSNIHRGLGQVEQSLGNPVQATNHYERALKSYIKIGDRIGEGTVLRALGDTAYLAGKVDEAKQHYAKALVTFHQEGNQIGEGLVLKALSELEYNVEHDKEAAAYQSQANTILQQEAEKYSHVMKEICQDAELKLRVENLNDADDDLRWCERVARDLQSPQQQSRALVNLGHVHRVIGNHKLSRQFYDNARVLYQEQRNTTGEGHVFTGKAHLERHLGDDTLARRYYADAKQLYKIGGQKSGEANAQLGLGHLERRLGNLEQARTDYRKAQALYHETNNFRGEAYALTLLGDIERLLDRLTSARILYNKALEYYQKKLKEERGLDPEILGPGEANVFVGLGDIARLEGKYAEAQEHYQKAFTYFKNVGSWPGRATVYRGLGDLERTYGTVDRARYYYNEALLLYQETHDHSGQANALGGLGHLERLVGNLEQAQQHYEDAQVNYEKGGDRRGVAQALIQRAKISWLFGNLGEAYQHYADAQANYEKIEDRMGIAQTLIERAEISRLFGKIEQAHEYYKEAAQYYGEMGDESHVLTIHTKMRNLVESTPLLEKPSPL
ncbi:MAG: tetratricopeptide repeat protein [Nitrospirales bacterium]|nr:tetratricopeptide repeat protein [Nitrospirales bacterium]